MRICLCFVGLLFSLPTYAQGFNCSQAQSPQEKAICASPELSKADSGMTAAYRAWLDTAPAAWQPEVRENQRAWLRQRSSACKEGDSAAVTKCLLEMEKSRTEALQGMVQRRNGIQFVWRSLHLTAPDSSEVAKMMRENGQPDSGRVDAAWPQSASSALEWAAWNKAIEEAALSTSSPDGKGTTRLNQSNAVDQDIDINVELDSVTDNLVAASINGFEYGHGAAHPNHGTTQFNWLLKEKRKLKAEDIFQPKSNWKQQLYTRTDKYLHSQLDEQSGGSYQNWLGKPADMAKTLRGIVTDPQRWQIDPKGLTIVFNPYEVTAYCCTPEPFTMPWASLRPLLQPGFAVPSAAQ